MKTLSMTRRSSTRGLLGASIVALSVGCGSVYASVERGMRNGVPYEVGGWSSESAREVKAQAENYPVMLIFAQRDTGEYLADVRVTVRDAKGNAVASFDDTGPLLLLGLQPGQYRIEAERGGSTYTRALRVDTRNHVQTVFRLPATGGAA